MQNEISFGGSPRGSAIIIDARDILCTVKLLGAGLAPKQIEKICSRSINEALARGPTISPHGLDGMIDLVTSFQILITASG